MDPSKAFDSIEHELLIVKLNTYGFSKKTQLMILIIYLEENKE